MSNPADFREDTQAFVDETRLSFSLPLRRPQTPEFSNLASNPTQEGSFFWRNPAEPWEESQYLIPNSINCEDSSQSSTSSRVPTTPSTDIQRCSREDRIQVQTLIQFGIKYKEIMASLNLTLRQVHYATTHRITP